MTSGTDPSRWGSPQIVDVGWLAPENSYPQGAISAEFIDALVLLLVDPWEPVASAGWHDCGFCRLSIGPRILKYKGTTIEMGIRNLFVPGNDVIYAAPSLIAHYIDAHGYSPPEEFQAAVLACPKMRSTAYYKAILENGPEGFATGGPDTAGKNNP